MLFVTTVVTAVELLPGEVDSNITRSDFMYARISALIVALAVGLQEPRALAQQRGGTPQTDKVQPVNSGANPYRVIRDWAQLTSEGRPWGGSNGVAIDRDGRSVST